MSEFRIRPIWIGLSVLVSALVAVAGAAGIFLKGVYARETASWAAQGIGQDFVNLTVAVPALLASAWFLRKGSVRALLVWMGVLIYIIYSYLMYAFSVHFGLMFPVYVAALGLSFYALFGCLFSLDRGALGASFPPAIKVKPAAVYLMVSGVVFAGLWLSDIVHALVTGTLPAGLAETGLPVNFVHVEDLGFILPGMIITSVLLWKRKALGYIFAVPLMVFAAAMGIGIISMFATMSRRGLGGGGPMGIVMGALVAISVLITVIFLNDIK
jgi:hypothetical protein